jgi:ribokinase
VHDLKKPKIAVLGSCNMDIYSWTEHLPEPGETVIGDCYSMVMGGKGANQAVAACKQGAEVAMIGRVGDDMFGERMLATLLGHGVQTRYIQVSAGSGSGVALVVVDRKPENVIVVIPGTNMHIDCNDVDCAADLIRSSDVLMMQLEIPLEAIQRALQIASGGKTLRILNPAPARPLPDEILQNIDLITPNQNEAKMLTGIAADTVEGAEAAGKALLARGVPLVIITLGPDGALLVTPDSSCHVDGYRIEDAHDTTGAGDAFMGGLSVALAEGKPMLEAIRCANAVAGLSTRRPGAMPSMPDRTEVEEFIRARAL